MEYFRKIQDSGHHECEMFEGEGQSEAAQSSRKWKKCTKNPGHEKFITVQEFQQNLVIKVPDVIDRERISAVIDRTVRLKVYYTSKDRPDDDPFSALKGTKIPRYGTGNVENNRRLGFRGKDPFLGVQRGVKTHWKFIVQTAYHVVFNTEEARATKVDFFFDDESCERDGRMKSATGVEVLKRGSGRDMTEILCTTCDEDLARRILSAQRHSKFAQIDLHQWFPLSCDGERNPVVIVSHPHGQPKNNGGDTHRNRIVTLLLYGPYLPWLQRRSSNYFGVLPRVHNRSIPLHYNPICS